MIYVKPKIYEILNLSIAGIILITFIYSIIYTSDKVFTPTKCVHGELLGAQCPICGMTFGFASIVKGRFAKALIIQPNSVRIFLFLIVLLLTRIITIVLLLKTNVSYEVIITTDIIVAVLLFILTFRSIIPQMFYIYYKMLITGNTAFI